MEKVYQEIEKRDDIISSACGLKVELMCTRKQNVAAEHLNFLFADVLLVFRLVVFVGCCQTMVVDIYVNRFKYIIVGREQAFDINIDI